MQQIYSTQPVGSGAYVIPARVGSTANVNPLYTDRTALNDPVEDFEAFLDNVKDDVERFVAQARSGAGPNAYRSSLTGALEAMTEWIDAIQSKLEPLAAQWTAIFARLTSDLAEQKLAELQPIMDRIDELANRKSPPLTDQEVKEFQDLQLQYQVVSSKWEHYITTAQGLSEGWNSCQQDIARSTQNGYQNTGAVSGIWSSAGSSSIMR